ncbi:hypothetical protein [Arthrobacter sp. NicSoilB11]|uniref:hypothetical protein n=1 Tax=Arthrobacter sp. NicSoilB11 TaxID=2830999 RepID=UPI001CC62CE8|nr:hypothetical protein [Arthrobacter sp. NicSoilB11]BCW76408.1 hypothetical protein NicSoilB11_27330 [Arthrobacter sp. NicSoilB11]
MRRDGVGALGAYFGARVRSPHSRFHHLRTLAARRSREAYREDRRRWNVTVIRGVPTLRVTFEMLVRDPAEFVGIVRKALAMYGTAR